MITDGLLFRVISEHHSKKTGDRAMNEKGKETVVRETIATLSNEADGKELTRPNERVGTSTSTLPGAPPAPPRPIVGVYRRWGSPHLL